MSPSLYPRSSTAEVESITSNFDQLAKVPGEWEDTTEKRILALEDKINLLFERIMALEENAVVVTELE